MRYYLKTWGPRPGRHHWTLGLALAFLLVLALACGQQESTPASQPAVMDTGAAEAAAQAKAAAEQALAAAEQALAAADSTETAEVAAQALAAAEQALAAAELAKAAAEAPRRGEDRPQITVIGAGEGSGSVSASASGSGTGSGSASGTSTGSGSGSVSGTGIATAAMAGQVETSGLSIPTGLTPETSGPTKSDGYYTPTTNREIYQKIATDYQEIVKLTNVISEGKPLPAAEIWLLYEAGSHTRLGSQSRTLRSWAIGSTPATYFPDSAAFYDSASFLDDPIENAVRGRREAENYSDAQKRQAINKSLLRIIYHRTKFYMTIGGDRMSSRLVDEAWAIYVGEEVNGQYPNSLAAVAQGREGNFGRQGAIDIPLRQAMDRARQAADDGDTAAYEAAARDVYSRFNAIFYLSTVRYIGRVSDDAQAGNHDALGTHQVEALAFYRSIQPDVAKANPASDQTIVAYLEADPSQVTTASRNEALAALNGTASALFLEPSDLVTRYDDDTGDGPSGAPPPYTGELEFSSSLFIPVGLPLETSGPSESDGYYYPTTNREHYQKISSDYREIAKLTDMIKEGNPLPAANIFLLYEVGMHTRIGPRSKTLRGFARDPDRAEEYPLAAEFYGSGNFLDSPINNAIRGRAEAEDWTDAQKRQAINKGILRILYHWSKHYVIGGCADLDSGDVDEGWAIYVGEAVDGDYPNSLSALARSREGNFGREGTIDIPLRQAFEQVRQAADRGDSAACAAAAQEVYSTLQRHLLLGHCQVYRVSY